MNRMRLVAVAIALACLGSLTACTGVPRSSAPQVVTAVDAAQPTALQASSPTNGADPRTVVREFLSASELADTRTQVAQSFLTRQAFQRWNGSTVTVLDPLNVGISENGVV